MKSLHRTVLISFRRVPLTGRCFFPLGVEFRFIHRKLALYKNGNNDQIGIGGFTTSKQKILVTKMLPSVSIAILMHFDKTLFMHE